MNSYVYLAAGCALFLLIVVCALKLMGKAKKGNVGTVSQLRRGRTIGGLQFTSFLIEGPNGSVFAAALPSHVYDINDGDIIEYWSTWDQVVSQDRYVTRTNRDGTKSVTTEKYYWFRLKKYRIITRE